MIYEWKLFLGINGVSANDLRTTEFWIQSNKNPGDASFITMANAGANVLKTVLASRTTIVRSLITPKKAPGTGSYPRGYAKPVFHNIVGTRVSGTNAQAAITDVVGLFGKEGIYGNPGIQKLRGCIFTNEFTNNGSGVIVPQAPFVQAPFDAFGPAFIAAVQGAGHKIVLPPPSDGTWDTDHRPVLDMSFTGLGMVKPQNNRRSLTEEKEDVAKRELVQIARDYDRAYRQPNGIYNQVAGAVFNALLARLQKAVGEYGMSLVLKYAESQALKALLLALA